MSEVAKSCAKRIRRAGQFHSSPCSRKAIGDHGFCAVHAPEAVEKRKARREAEWAAKEKIASARWAEVKERERKLEAFPELLAALKTCYTLVGSIPVCEATHKALFAIEGAIAKAEGRP